MNHFAKLEKKEGKKVEKEKNISKIKKKKQQTVCLCGIFTLQPVNEFKMAAGLARSHNIKESDSR